MAPVLTGIENTMKTLIEGMTVAGGYNYNWSTANQPDLALTTFPCAEILVVEESNLDDTGGSSAGMYANEVLVDVIVHTNLSSVADIPNWSINAEHNKALDDLKKVFGTNYQLSGYGEMIFYRGMEREIHRNGEVFVPGMMRTHWLVRYDQSRTNPEQLGC